MRRYLLILCFLICAATARAQQTVFVPLCAGTNDTARFSTIIAAIGANQGTIRLPYKRSTAGSRCAVNTLTIPANITLDNTDGTGIKVNTGQTLTIVGPAVSPPKLFFSNALSGQGTVSFSGNKSIEKVYPQWWGAIGDGTTDSLNPIKAALVAGAGKNIHFVAGDYLTSSALIVLANTTISGDGYASKIFCHADGWPLWSTTDLYGIFVVKNVSKVRFTNLRIHGTKTAPLDPVHDGIWPRNASTPKLIYLEGNTGTPLDGIMIDHCWFENSAWEGIWQGGAIPSTVNIQITNNEFYSIDGPSALTGNFENAVVSNNVFKNCLWAIGVLGRFLTVTGNVIINATHGGIGVGEELPITGAGYSVVTGNTVYVVPNVAGSNWYGIGVAGGTLSEDHPVIISGNSVFVDNIPAIAGAGAGIWIYNQAHRADVSSNVVEINGSGIGLSAQGTVTGTQVSFRGNTVRFMNAGVGSNNIGLIGRGPVAGSTLDIYSSNNRVYGLTRANSNLAYDYRAQGGGTVNAWMANDLMTEGYLYIGDLTLPHSDEVIDNIPLTFSTNLASWANQTSLLQAGMLSFSTYFTLSVASGAIDISGATPDGYSKRRTRIAIDPEAAAATDDLDTINGGQEGDILIIKSFLDGRDTTLKNNTGNLKIGSDFTLATTRDRIVLEKQGSNWYQISRNTN